MAPTFGPGQVHRGLTRFAPRALKQLNSFIFAEAVWMRKRPEEAVRRRRFGLRHPGVSRGRSTLHPQVVKP
jgi:hypothetical protein